MNVVVLIWEAKEQQQVVMNRILCILYAAARRESYQN